MVLHYVGPVRRDGSLKRVALIAGAGMVIGAALAAFGLQRAVDEPGVVPVLAVMLGVSTAVLCGLALGRLAYMDRRAARIRRRWGSRSRGT